MSHVPSRHSLEEGLALGTAHRLSLGNSFGRPGPVGRGARPQGSHFNFDSEHECPSHKRLRGHPTATNCFILIDSHEDEARCQAR